MVQVFPIREKAIPSFPECLPTSPEDSDDALDAQPAVRCIDVHLYVDRI